VGSSRSESEAEGAPASPGGYDRSVNPRALLPLAALLLLGVLAGSLRLARRGDRAPEEAAAPVGPAFPPATALPAGDPGPAPGTPAADRAPDPRRPRPARDGSPERRVSLGGPSLPEGVPERPEPGELEGPLVRLAYGDGTPCFEAQQRLDESGVWVLHGRWTSWHENGQVQEQGWYENHREVGGWQWWDDNGQRIAVGSFVDGKREGVWSFWYSDGVRQLDAQYSDGKATGLWTLYSEDGRRAAEGAFVDGEISGPWTVWDELGAVDPERSGLYEHGVKVAD